MKRLFYILPLIFCINLLAANRVPKLEGDVIANLREFIAFDQNVQFTFIEKFGENPDVDAFVDEDLWTFGSTYTFLTSASILYAASADDSDTQDVKIFGLDSNWDEINETVTLTGNTSVATTQSFIRLIRAFNDNSTELAGNVGIMSEDSFTAGVVDVATSVVGFIRPVFQQTQMAIMSIPNNHTGYLYFTHASIGRGIGQPNTDRSADIVVLVRENGKVFRSKYNATIQANGAGIVQHPFVIPLAVPERADVKLRILNNLANNTVFHGGFTLILVDDN